MKGGGTRGGERRGGGTRGEESEKEGLLKWRGDVKRQPNCFVPIKEYAEARKQMDSKRNGAGSEPLPLEIRRCFRWRCNFPPFCAVSFGCTCLLPLSGVLIPFIKLLHKRD